MPDSQPTGTEQQIFRIYRPVNSTTSYAIKLSPQGVSIFDTSTKSHTFVDGNFETIHQALGVYLLRQLKVDAAYSEIMMGAFDQS